MYNFQIYFTLPELCLPMKAKIEGEQVSDVITDSSTNTFEIKICLKSKNQFGTTAPR
jgi:hypothetical protein